MPASFAEGRGGLRVTGMAEVIEKGFIRGLEFPGRHLLA